MFAVFTPTFKLVRLLAGLLLALILAACLAPTAGGPTINPSAPVSVALLVPRGSANSGDALLAQSLENSARLAIGDLQGVVIDLKVYDTAGNAAQAAQVAQQAVNEGARIILGPVYAESANAAGRAVAGRDINVLAFSNNPSIAGGNVFILGNTFENTADRLAAYAAARGKGNILILYGNDVAEQQGREAIRAAIGRTAAREAGSLSYEVSQQGVIQVIPAVRDTIANTGADALFLTATTAGALPLLSQLLPEAGVTPDVIQFIGLTRWDIPIRTIELPGVQNGWFAVPDPVRAAQFQSRYQAAFGGQPHPIGGLAYDGIAAIGALVGAGKPDALTGAALTQSAGFQGVNGIFRLRPDGTNERGLAVATIQNKQVVVIDPAPTSFSGAGF